MGMLKWTWPKNALKNDYFDFEILKMTKMIFKKRVTLK